MEQEPRDMTPYINTQLLLDRIDGRMISKKTAKYLVKKTITYYAEILATSPEEALEIAEEVGHIDLDAESVGDDWELAE